MPEKNYILPSYYQDMRCILPYATDNLTPLFSQLALDLHYHGHHKRYANTTSQMLQHNEQLTDSIQKKQLSLIEIINYADKLPERKLFHNVAQVFNHNLFFLGLTNKNFHNNINLRNMINNPDIQYHEIIEIIADCAQNTLSTKIYKIIQDSFRDMMNMIDQWWVLSDNHFGSGWSWLIYNYNTNKLQILVTSNADTPITSPNMIPIMNIDLWEHSYYPDYQNKKHEYYKKIFAFIDWQRCEEIIAQVITTKKT